MRPVTVLVSACGAPGTAALLGALRENGEGRPVRLDGDRRGYVIAVGDNNVQALQRAEAAARKFDVKVA